MTAAQGAIIPRIAAASLLLPGLLFAGASPRAQGDEVWTYQCMTEDPTTPAFCTTEIALGEGAEDLLIYFVHGRPGRSPLVVNTGRLPAAELAIEVDDEPPVRTSLCEPGLCYFDLEASRQLLDLFRKGWRARLTVAVTQAGEPTAYDFTLRGFTAAYTAHEG